MNRALRGCLVRRFRSLTLLYITAIIAVPVFSQTAPQPQQAELLNGLRVLIWPRPGDQTVLLKLRVHSGAAFDLAGKSGEMALLGDILFPDPATREYFEEMQGRLAITTDYDSLTITLEGRTTEFERIVEILRNAVVSPQLTVENVKKVRDGRIGVVRSQSVSPAILADRAIASRLFGDFPYGQPYAGSVESLSRIERADLLLARERFLNPNNSTLAVVGGVPPNRVTRVLRQLLGTWRKSERIVPATFRLPQPPAARVLLINTPADESAEIRLAVRGLARSDRDALAADLLAPVAQYRWEKLVPELARNPVHVRHQTHVLPGIFVMGAAVNSALATRTLKAAHEVLQSLAGGPISAAELDSAKRDALATTNERLAKPEGQATAWSDIDTYKLPSIVEQRQLLNNISTADLQRTASRLFRDTTVAAVVVGNSELLKTDLERALQIEILGEVAPKGETSPAKEPVGQPGSVIKPD